MNRLKSLAILLISIVAVAWWAYSGFAFLSETEILFVPPESLEFGTVVEQDRFAWRLPILNKSDRAITILQFERSCKCTKIEPQSLTIAPHSESAVHLTIDLTKTLPTEADERREETLERDFSTIIRPIVDGKPKSPPRRFEWRINGRVKRFLTLSAPQIDFTSMLVRRAPLPSRTIQVKVDESVQELEIIGSRPEIAFATEADASSARTFRIAATPLESIPLGRIDCTLSVIPVFKDGTKGPRTIVPILGTIVEDISLSPPQLHFGKVQLGVPTSGEISIVSLTNQPFVIVPDASSKFTLEPRSSDAASKHVLKITFVPDSYGMNSCELSAGIHYTSSNTDSRVGIKCAYFGVD